MTNTLLSIVEKLLYENHITYDKKELAFQIQSHPSFPSLYAITDVLNHFNIENIAAEVTRDLETLEQLPNVFIAQISTKKGSSLVVVSKEESQYIVTSEDKKNKKISKNEFLTFFTGIVIAVDKNEKEKSAKSNMKLKNIIFFFCSIILIIYLLINQNTDLYVYIFTALSSIGTITSYTILKQELGESSLMGEKLCSQTNNKKNCDAVLNSKGGEIIKNHKLSDISIIYFLGLLLIGLFTKDINLLSASSFLALPVTLYSIYYQYNIVKSWCMLCLTIVGVLWIQAITSYFQFNNFYKIFPIKINNILIASVSFIAIYMLWSFVKPLVEKNYELHKEKIDFVKFKRSFNLFNTLLQKSSDLNTIIKNTKEITFGNKKANFEIIIITNPFCGHCKPVHKIVDEILERYNDAVKVIIRFNISTDKIEDKGTIVSTKLIELFNEKGEKECRIAMSEIYGNFTFKKWISKWGQASNKNTPLSILENQREWCTNNGVNFTPEILIQGKSFPKEYKKEDLLFFIKDLEEYYQPS